MRRFLFVCLSVLGFASFGLSQSGFGQSALGQSGATPLTEAQILERGRLLTSFFYAVNIEPVFNQFIPELQAGVGGLEAFRSYRQGGVEQFGDELKMLKEEVVTENGVIGYVRTTTFVKRPKMVWNVIFVFDPISGGVVNFGIEFAGNLP
jgi:hypothetical protein